MATKLPGSNKLLNSFPTPKDQEDLNVL